MPKKIIRLMVVIAGLCPLSTFALPITEFSGDTATDGAISYNTASSVIIFADSPISWWDPFLDIQPQPYLAPPIVSPIFNISPNIPFFFSPLPPITISPFFEFDLPPGNFNPGFLFSGVVPFGNFDIFSYPFLYTPPLSFNCCSSISFSFSLTPPTANVPEPASLALIGIGIAGLRISRRLNKHA